MVAYLRCSQLQISMNKRAVKGGLLGLFFLFVSLFSAGLYAQAPVAQSSADIYRKIQKLNVLGTVLFIAAHPDDENTRLLAYLAREEQYRTGYLSLTRGDGGQNLIGNEQGVELGLIRTQELLAARRIDGAEQFFSRAYDFGFSKNPEEAMRTWGHEKVLSDVVWMIRNYQPDVIITRFPGDARAGHGHHSASAILANEAFTAAADPNAFPEQLKDGLAPWKAKRILWNTYSFGSINTTADDQFKMEVGAYNKLLGKGYGEIASDSRSQHRSQGFGNAKTRGRSLEYFITTGGDTPKQGLMDGINTSWARVAGGNAVQPLVTSLIGSYSFEHPEKSVDQLVALHKAVAALSPSVYRNTKLAEIEDLIVQCAGIFAETTTDAAYIVQGQTVKLNYTINSRSEDGVTLSAIRLDNGADSALSLPLELNVNRNIQYNAYVALDKQESQPYWLQKPMNVGSFELKKQSDIASPENAPAFTAGFKVKIRSLELEITRPVMYKHTDPVKGEMYEPITITTPLMVSLSPSMILTNVRANATAMAQPVSDIFLRYTSAFEKQQVSVNIRLEQGGKRIYSRDTIIAFEKGKTYEDRIALKSLMQQSQPVDITAVITLTLDGKAYSYSRFLRHIAYDHIPDINYYTEDHVKAIGADIKTGGKKKIGYIPGAGDKVPQALEQMGYEVTLLHDANFTPANLAQFDAVIAGVRAYNIFESLDSKYPALMQYVQNGGNFIAQYNTHAALKARMSPYPMSIINERVTDELAPVQLLLPAHPVLNIPNKITVADFDGWIQERSIYHGQTTDTHFETPIGMADSGETLHKGSLMIAPYGKGNFVYTGIVFFRELPAGVPGAFRLMANLIALPQHKSN